MCLARYAVLIYMYVRRSRMLINFFFVDSLERVQIPDEQFLDVFVCNVHSTDNICVNLSGENYSVSVTSANQHVILSFCHYVQCC